MELFHELSSQEGSEKVHSPLLWEWLNPPPWTHISPSVLLARMLDHMTTKSYTYLGRWRMGRKDGK